MGGWYRVLAVSVIFSAALSACWPEQTHDVEYYKAHKDEMTKKMAECNNNPGEAAKKPNCVNAAAASFWFELHAPSNSPVKL